MKTTPLPNLLPAPKGPRFQVVQSWPTYGPRDELQGVGRRVVATVYTYGFAQRLANRAWAECGGGDADLEIRDLRPEPAPLVVPPAVHPADCPCTSCQELPF
jgi:hypothetical protein